MSSNELQYLFQEKVREGKSIITAGDEVEFFKESQIEFKNLKKEINHLNTELNKKDREIEELKNKVKENKNKSLIQGLGLTGRKDVVTKETRGASINNMRRIIKFTEVGGSYTKSDLGKEFMFPTTVVEEILDFLSKYTNVKFRQDGCRYVREN